MRHQLYNPSGEGFAYEHIKNGDSFGDQEAIIDRCAIFCNDPRILVVVEIKYIQHANSLWWKLVTISEKKTAS